MRPKEWNTGIATGSSDDQEGQWGTDGGQNQLRLRQRGSEHAHRGQIRRARRGR